MKVRIWVVLFAGMLIPTAQGATPTDKTTSTTPASPPVAASSKTPDNSLCLSCHSDVGDKIAKQVHGPVACQMCHVKHDDYPHPEGVAKPVCSTCHSNMAKDYARGVHGQAVKKGNSAAPECSTCHGKAHEIESTKTAKFREAVPGLCGSCHADTGDEYQQSVHGQAMAKGVVEAPVCIDCHGEHSILPPQDAASPVHPNHIRDTCANCHNNVRLTQSFGLPNDRIVSFDASYHGLASKSGDETVANCASCHGVHNIRASSDPKSTVSAANLAKTCGHCHQGAGQRFAIGPVHTMPGKVESAAVKWVRWVYLLIIPLTIGFMLLHNVGDWLHKVRVLRFSGKIPEPPPAPAAIAVSIHAPLRTFVFERIEHAMLVISFMVLGWTGFALKYPDHWWARPLLIWEGSHDVRGIVHRGASVLFISAALAHVLSLIFNKRLRDHWRSLFPNSGDLKELIANSLYNLGLRKQFPGRSSHSYVEKMEYWALVWGTVVMAVTGVLLWATNLTLKWMPKIVLDLATSIHFYEAILATLAIVAWHFYFVIFDPDVYPMDFAWLTGKSPRKESAEGHA